MLILYAEHEINATVQSAFRSPVDICAGLVCSAPGSIPVGAIKC